jgi:hypothetical protein
VTAPEPLRLTLEETARRIAYEWLEQHGYAPGIPEQAQRWLDAGEHEDFDAVYDLMKTLGFVRFVLERVPRDPTAELVEALRSCIEPLVCAADVCEAEGAAAVAWACRAAVESARAVLARVKGEGDE